jgi:hypothetical protein
LLKANHIPGNIPIEEDGLDQDGIVRYDFGPVRHKCSFVARWKVCHLDRFRDQLLFEEYGEIGCEHSAELNIIWHRIFFSKELYQSRRLRRGKGICNGNRLRFRERRRTRDRDAAEQEQPEGAGQADQQASDPNGARREVFVQGSAEIGTIAQEKNLLFHVDACVGGWAILNFLGEEGYKKIIKEVQETTQKLIDGINAIEGLQVLGEPAMCMFSFKSDTINVYQLADEMSKHGWYIQGQFSTPLMPRNLHISVNHGTLHKLDALLKDLCECFEIVKRSAPWLARRCKTPTPQRRSVNSRPARGSRERNSRAKWRLSTKCSMPCPMNSAIWF